MTQDKDLIKARAQQILEEYGAVDAAHYLAETLFEGVEDKSGAPYIGHLRRVMAGAAARAADSGIDEETLSVIALLHDVIEDIPGWTKEDLLEIGFSGQAVAGVVAVTKLSEDEPYFNAIVRVGECPQAIPVKRSDLKDNSNLFRFQHIPTDGDIARVRKYFVADKYLKSIEKGETAPGTCVAEWMVRQPAGMQDQALLEKNYRFPDGLMRQNGLRLPKAFPPPGL